MDWIIECILNQLNSFDIMNLERCQRWNKHRMCILKINQDKIAFDSTKRIKSLLTIINSDWWKLNRRLWIDYKTVQSKILGIEIIKINWYLKKKNIERFPRQSFSSLFLPNKIWIWIETAWVKVMICSKYLFVVLVQLTSEGERNSTFSIQTNQLITSNCQWKYSKTSN